MYNPLAGGAGQAGAALATGADPSGHAGIKLASNKATNAIAIRLCQLLFINNIHPSLN
jgi:hypothetical protein